MKNQLEAQAEELLGREDIKMVTKKKKPIKAYAKGVRFERKIVNVARDNGLIAARSAGSHSPIDVFTIDVESKVIEFIQAKKGKSGLTKKQRTEFEAMTGRFKVNFKEVSE